MFTYTSNNTNKWGIVESQSRIEYVTRKQISKVGSILVALLIPALIAFVISLPSILH